MQEYGDANETEFGSSPLPPAGGTVEKTTIRADARNHDGLASDCHFAGDALPDSVSCLLALVPKPYTGADLELAGSLVE
jgi:hypothetical protein